MAKPLGELLVREKLISINQLQRALEEQKKSGGRLVDNLIKLGFAKDDQLANFLSSQYGIPVVNLDDYQIDSELIKIVPKEMCIKHTIIPINRAGSSLVIAVADPSNIFVVDDVKFLTGYNVERVLASYSQIKSAIDKYYGAEQKQQAREGMSSSISDTLDVLEVITEDVQDINVSELEKSASDAPIVKFVNAVITDAINKGASDIHIEPYEKYMRIRYRIDGVLYEVSRPPLAIKDAISSRIKIMAKMNISERRLPQDGRIRMVFPGDEEPIDFRVSTLPSIFGERIVLRILRKAGLQQDMTKLGFEPKQLEDYQWAISQPYGMVLVTGPTGSGKTTTLYSALMELNRDDVNLSTVEEPVEYNIRGMNQVQVRPEVGLTFAAALRSFLRQDPDVIMVGEIRDLETAEIAIKSALTGHLVLSTLHTNDAPSTITRLLNMGVEPFLVASAVLIIVSQRLVRKICPDCKEEVSVSREVLEGLGVPKEKIPTFKVYKGKGCESCNNIGYKGRIGIYENLRFNREIREAILRGDSTAEIRRIAIKNGMITLREAALKKLGDGITTIEEVIRTTAVIR
ncbi:MAG: type IV-A pilus assembly ATPase PilB [Deltaproteobacteria bacterium]|nr:type IV-A pilus assembly ATPase PilB [Deltaproteobacteria bacterium]